MKPNLTLWIVRQHSSWMIHFSFGMLAVCILLSLGCNEQTVRSQSPEELDALAAAKITLVGDRAVPAYLQPMRVEGISLVTGLKDTGSDPPPSAQRAELIAEMQKRNVKNPNAILASKTTALVLVRGYIRPGARQGDSMDLEVRVPGRSETTSLRGGWLMETRLSDYAALGGILRRGHDQALAKGPILVDPSASEEKDPVLLKKGRVLGGGKVLKSRALALAVKPEFKSVSTSSQVERAINSRFHTFQSGIKAGVATAKQDDFIELNIHPRYRHNIPRYLQVVRSIPLYESSAKRARRLTTLKEQLNDPITASRAVLCLEAIGHEGIPILKEALNSSSTEIRFHAGEALAYLGESEAAPVLAKIAKEERAFRVFALTALSGVDDAFEQLLELMDVPSAETRYGAFRALWTMDENEPLVRGEILMGQFSYHVLNTQGEPLIHATKSFRSELVLFGNEQRFVTPLLLEAGPDILIHSQGGDQIKISKFSPGEPDEQRIVSSRVDDVIRAVAELGGTYPDVVQALQMAADTNALPGRFVVDALPEAGRSYTRQNSKNEEDSLLENGAKAKNSVNSVKETEEDDQNPDSNKGFFGRIFPFAKQS